MSIADRQVICKKDGKPMFFIAESEKMSDGSRRTTYYYKCPICGYRIEAEQLTISVEDESIVVRRILKFPSSS